MVLKHIQQTILCDGAIQSSRMRLCPLLPKLVLCTQRNCKPISALFPHASFFLIENESQKIFTRYKRLLAKVALRTQQNCKPMSALFSHASFFSDWKWVTEEISSLWATARNFNMPLDILTRNRSHFLSRQPCWWGWAVQIQKMSSFVMNNARYFSYDSMINFFIIFIKIWSG